MPTMLTVQIHM